MNEHLVLTAIALAAVSGVPGLLTPRTSPVGQWLANILLVAGCLLGLFGAVTAGDGAELVLPWSVPGGAIRVAIDGLSAFFLLPVFLLGMLGSIYGLSYWKQAEHPDNGRKLRLFYGFMIAGMALLLIARNALLFLIGWEMMALSAFFLVSTEDTRADARAAGYLYLVATHTATLALFGMFALLAAMNGGSFALTPIADARAKPELVFGVLALALIGFGLKAGIMPLHVWLPSSHAMAPSHVSCLMSGVLIKMGIYGLVRVGALLPPLPLWWGELLLALGVISGVLGVAFAIGQHDLKRLLAYHSIENIGIIVMGLGLAAIGRSTGRSDWIVLGLAGGLLHVWNHALFKGLLFLSAGSVIHATHTREIDHLGGLARRMPRTGVLFLLGAVAICGLPPLNGFVSEFMIYLGLFHSLELETGNKAWIAAALAIPGLALIGALALACFVKVFASVFLGTERSEHAHHAHESDASMIGPMAVLGGCCVFIGLAPELVSGLLSRAIVAAAPQATPLPNVTALAPLRWLTWMGLLLVAVLVTCGLVLVARFRKSEVREAVTWDCGYAAASSRVQYTSSSFAEMLVAMFSWALQPRVARPGTLAFFPPPERFASDVPDTVLDRGVVPALRFGAWVCSGLRWLQRGGAYLYLLYIFLVLMGLLLWHWGS